jgi:CRP-like cAMP-binding protein
MLYPQHLHILVVEYLTEKALELKTHLEELAVKKIVIVANWTQAEQYLNDEHFHLIILSDDGPKEDFEIALRSIREHTQYQSTPLIAYTKERNPEQIRSLIKAGFSGIIESPIDAARLRPILRNFIRKQNSSELVSLMSNAHFFKEFSDDDIKTLLQVAIVRNYPAGSSILQKGDAAAHFYVLLKGRVEVVVSKDNGQFLHLFVEEGNTFGEMGVLNENTRSAYCFAADNCDVLEIGSQIIEDTEYSLRLKIFTQLAFVLARRITSINKLLENEKEASKITTRSARPEAIIKASEPKEEATAIEAELEPEEEVTENLPVVQVLEDTTVPPPLPKNPVAATEGDDEEAPANPFIEPTGTAEEYDTDIRSQEEYEVLTKKLNLRSDFINNKIPIDLCDMIANKLTGYWTGGKLAKINPHKLWDPKWLTDGTPRLKRAMHLVVLCSKGQEAYETSFLGLPFCHRVIGLSQIGCVGSFLHSDDAIDRYFSNTEQKKAMKMDMEIPIDRIWKGEDCIEFLTHTQADVRPETLFLVFDNHEGKNTALARKSFPQHQIVTVVYGTRFNPEIPSSVFTQPERDMIDDDILVQKGDYDETGFYTGQTLFLPDFSYFYKDTDALNKWGHVFGYIGIFAKIGPDYSGVTWGSKGGAEGAIKAARALYGVKGAQSAQDLASAINWADG